MLSACVVGDVLGRAPQNLFVQQFDFRPSLTETNHHGKASKIRRWLGTCWYSNRLPKLTCFVGDGT